MKGVCHPLQQAILSLRVFQTACFTWNDVSLFWADFINPGGKRERQSAVEPAKGVNSYV